MPVMFDDFDAGSIPPGRWRMFAGTAPRGFYARLASNGTVLASTLGRQRLASVASAVFNVFDDGGTIGGTGASVCQRLDESHTFAEIAGGTLTETPEVCSGKLHARKVPGANRVSLLRE